MIAARGLLACNSSIDDLVPESNWPASSAGQRLRTGTAIFNMEEEDEEFNDEDFDDDFDDDFEDDLDDEYDDEFEGELSEDGADLDLDESADDEEGPAVGFEEDFE